MNLNAFVIASILTMAVSIVTLNIIKHSGVEINPLYLGLIQLVVGGFTFVVAGCFFDKDVAKSTLNIDVDAVVEKVNENNKRSKG